LKLWGNNGVLGKIDLEQPIFSRSGGISHMTLFDCIPSFNEPERIV